MRVLFSSTSTEGHVAPLLPLARAFADLGHDVAFATAPTYEARLQSAGFTTFAAGLDQAQIAARMQEYRPRLLALPPAERRPLAYTWRFAHIDAPAKLPELLRVAKEWRAELLVHDAAELCAPPVAASLGIPSVNQGFGQVIPAACHEQAADAVRALWDAVGLAPESRRWDVPRRLRRHLPAITCRRDRAGRDGEIPATPRDTDAANAASAVAARATGTPQRLRDARNHAR